MIIDELEKKLRPPEIGLKPYPPKIITLASGEQMVVREAKRAEDDVYWDVYGGFSQFYRRDESIPDVNDNDDSIVNRSALDSDSKG